MRQFIKSFFISILALSLLSAVVYSSSTQGRFLNFSNDEEQHQKPLTNLAEELLHEKSNVIRNDVFCTTYEFHFPIHLNLAPQGFILDIIKPPSYS